MFCGAAQFSGDGGYIALVDAGTGTELLKASPGHREHTMIRGSWSAERVRPHVDKTVKLAIHDTSASSWGPGWKV